MPPPRINLSTWYDDDDDDEDDDDDHDDDDDDDDEDNDDDDHPRIHTLLIIASMTAIFEDT